MGMLDGKTALITGAGQGVGLGIARAFAREGARLVITGRNAEKLERAVPELEQLGAKVVICSGDAGDRSNCEAAVQAAIDAFGQLDVLVNNAQSMTPGVRLEDLDEAGIDSVLGSGFYGTLWHMLAALPHLKETKGSVINLGSREGIQGGAGHSIYGAGKEAIRGLTRSVAREWGEYGIRINVLCPAAMTEAAVVYFEQHPEAKDIYVKDICLGRFGDSLDDIGPVALFLATDQSRYVTGQTINVDGGQTML
ncbi:MAG: SDR family NAD(P)-dependent oxidoreductase [Novosphingobium sp.]|nr:SDR family NAD(P)-dependent oxidoreductase [Novosphingobium sp.]